MEKEGLRDYKFTLIEKKKDPLIECLKAITFLPVHVNADLVIDKIRDSFDLKRSSDSEVEISLGLCKVIVQLPTYNDCDMKDIQRMTDQHLKKYSELGKQGCLSHSDTSQHKLVKL